jgi:alkanesulfonate monooxygenase SsuD/methylene tetrahydromethanopterin reductase-like flavin-dependent oxidoreductase (luciferase family)
MAEAVFTAQQTLEGSIAFYADLKGRLSKYARSTGGLKILPRVFPVVGRTRQEASDKFEQLQSLLEPLVGLDMLADLAGVEDIRTMPVDALIADLPETEGGKSRRARFLELAARENLTLRQLYQRVAGAVGIGRLLAPLGLCGTCRTGVAHHVALLSLLVRYPSAIQRLDSFASTPHQTGECASS